MKVYFPEGKRVHAEYNGFTHNTDQPTNIEIKLPAGLCAVKKHMETSPEFNIFTTIG